MDVRCTADPTEVLDRAGPFLGTRPVEHNVLATLLRDRAETGDAGRYWVVERQGDVAGVVFRSPDTFPALLSVMVTDAVEAAATAVARAIPDLSGVGGEAATASRFASCWAARRAVAAVPVAAHLVYRLEALRPPAGPGQIRAATADDRDLLVAWATRFHEEVGEPGSPPERMVDRRLAAGAMWLWEDGGRPVAMAAHAEPVAGLARIIAVFTPPDERNKGYACGCVAGLSAILEARGLRCMLYADLANPASNAVYRRIGYRPVAEMLRYRFG